MKNIILFFVISALFFPYEAKALDFMKDVNKLLDNEKKDAPVKEKSEKDKKIPTVSSASEKHYKTKSGFSINIPAGWNAAVDDKNNFRLDLASKPGVAVSVIMNDYGKDFPVDSSLKAYLQTAKDEKSKDTIEKYEELRLGSANGILRIEKAPADSGDPRRITFQGYAGSIGINIVASTRADIFEKYRVQLGKIVRSIKW